MTSRIFSVVRGKEHGQGQGKDRLCARIKFNSAFQACRQLKDEGQLLQQPSNTIKFLDAHAAISKIFVDARRRFCPPQKS